MNTFSSRDCIEYNGKLYFMTEPEAHFIELDYMDNRMRYVHTYNNISMNSVNIDLAVRIGNYGYFLEREGNYFIEYDFLSSKKKMYKINCHREVDGNYAFVTSYKNQLIICTRELGKLIVFDSNKKISQIIKYPDCEKDVCFVCGCKYENIIYLLAESGEKILTYDCEKGQFESFKLKGLQSGKVIDCACNANQIFVLTRYNEMYEIDIRTWIKKHICFSLKTNEFEVRRILMLKDNVLIMPGQGKNFYLYNLKEKDVKKINNWPKDIIFNNNRQKWSKFYGYCEDKKYYYFANRVINYYLRIDKQLGQFIWTKPQMPSLQEQIIYRVQDARDVLEEKDKSLKQYIEYIVAN